MTTERRGERESLGSRLVSRVARSCQKDDILLPRQPEALHSFKYKMQGSPLHMESLLLTLLCRSLKLSIRKEVKNGSAIVAVQCDEPPFHAPPKPRSYIVQRRSTLSPPAQVVSHSLQVSFQEEIQDGGSNSTVSEASVHMETEIVDSLW